MNELSLFTGIGGGLLGTKLLGWNHIGYVEWDDYCCKVLEQRIKDGILDDAPIWNIDIREFNKRIACLYRGNVDVITAGFPCQPFSVAGRRTGADDERNMWPATIECTRIVRPQYALLENVPGLLTSGYFGTILGDLAESGYDIRWRCLSAAEVGANHRRNRLWILADSTRIGRRGRDNEDAQGQGGSLQAEGSRPADQPEILADTANSRTQGMRKWENQTPEDISNTNGKYGKKHRTKHQFSEKGREVAFGRSGRSDRNWWSDDPAEGPTKSRVGRLAHGIPRRVDRLRAIGNAQVPAVVRAVWELLNDIE